MSIEQAISALADAMNAQTEALQRNTDISEKLLIQRGEAAPKADQASQIKPAEAEKPDTGEAEAEAKKTAAAERKAKAAAKKKAEAEAEAKAAQSGDDDLDDLDDDAEPVTLKDVKKAAVALRDTAGQDALDKVKKTFKLDAVKDITEENYGVFVRHCQQIIDDEDV